MKKVQRTGAKCACMRWRRSSCVDDMFLIYIWIAYNIEDLPQV